MEEFDAPPRKQRNKQGIKQRTNQRTGSWARRSADAPDKSAPVAPLTEEESKRQALKAQTRLMNKAVHYLGRYSASRQRLREVMGRFAMRKLEHLNPSEVRDAIEVIIDKCVALGYVDDAQFAATQARSQRRQGRSSLAIKQKLKIHRLDDEMISTAVEGADEGLSDGELVAALRFAKRRRLGPYRTDKSDDPIKRNRHMGSLARAGYSMTICRQIIDLEDEIAAEDLAYALANPEKD